MNDLSLFIAIEQDISARGIPENPSVLLFSILITGIIFLLAWGIPKWVVWVKNEHKRQKNDK